MENVAHDPSKLRIAKIFGDLFVGSNLALGNQVQKFPNFFGIFFHVMRLRFS